MSGRRCTSTARRSVASCRARRNWSSWRRRSRAPGAGDAKLRLADLDHEGIWGEVVFPSLGMWNASFRTREALKAAIRVSNDWAKTEIMERLAALRRRPPRCRCCRSTTPSRSSSARAEMGFRAVFLPTTPPAHDARLQPGRLGAVLDGIAEQANIVLAFHIGTDPVDLDAGESVGVVYRGPGGAVLNYTETTFSGQRAAMKMVASGALDRHPDLKVLVSEGGATWVPFLGDRMVEGYRQHNMMVRPKLSRTPEGDPLLAGVRLVPARRDGRRGGDRDGLPQRDVGQRLPAHGRHVGHTQETLHGLFDGVDDDTRYRITRGAFLELFPEVGEPEALVAA